MNSSAAQPLQPGVIVIDTREQLPLEFSAEWRTIRAKLPTGDYSLAGFHTMQKPGIIIERKSLSDLVRSITVDHDREMRKIERMKPFRFKGFVIEASYGEIERHEYESAASPQSVIQALAAIQVRHNVHIAWGGTRDGCARDVQSWFRQFARGVLKDHAALMKSWEGNEK